VEWLHPTQNIIKDVDYFVVCLIPKADIWVFVPNPYYFFEKIRVFLRNLSRNLLCKECSFIRVTCQRVLPGPRHCERIIPESNITCFMALMMY